MSSFYPTAKEGLCFSLVSCMYVCLFVYNDSGKINKRKLIFTFVRAEFSFTILIIK